MAVDDGRTEAHTYTIPEAARLLGIGRDTAYRAAKQHQRLTEGVPVIQIGRRLVVPKAALHRALGIDDKQTA